MRAREVVRREAATRRRRGREATTR
jgi:hypothetical protein